jgi:hypothetical protein
MNLITAILLSAIPAILIIVANIAVQRSTPGETPASRRWLFLLLASSAGILVFVFLFRLLSPPNGMRFDYFLAVASLPLLLGLLALVILDAGVWVGMPAIQKVLAFLAAILVVVMAFFVLRPYGYAFVVLAGAIVLALVWALNKIPLVFLAGLSLLVFLMLTLLTDMEYGLNSPPLPGLERSMLGPLLFFLPVFGVVLAALLVYGALRDREDRNGWDKSGWFSRGVIGVLVLMLIGVLAYDIYWSSLWDQTIDGLGGIFTAVTTSITAIAAGMIMGVRAIGNRRTVAGLFTVLVPMLLFGAFQLGTGADYQALTAQRAGRIQAALEAYKTENGAYPPDLQALVPGKLLAVPQPLIFPGESWCYHAGPNSYQLSTYFRRFFSTPFSLHIYASAGSPPGPDLTCQNHLDELKQKYDPMDYPAP